MTAIRRARPRRAFSLVEILVVVAVIGVLTGVAIPAYRGITDSTRNVEAEDFAESLNRAVLRFNQGNWDLPTLPDAATADDELVVLRSLQYKWPSTSLKPGSPYFAANYNPPASSDSEEYRLRWNGRSFDVLRPGTAGTGLRKRFDGSDYTAAAYVFPADYKPAGAR